MNKKQLWNKLRKHRRRFSEERQQVHLAMYFAVRVAQVKTPITDKGYLKRRVEQLAEYGR